MTKQFSEIRTLLDRLEADLLVHDTTEAGSNFAEVELASVIEDIVDLLTPILKPYQVPFYWFLFRHSFLKNGGDLLRVSVRGMQKGVVLSKTSIAGTNRRRISCEIVSSLNGVSEQCDCQLMMCSTIWKAA